MSKLVRLICLAAFCCMFCLSIVSAEDDFSQDRNGDGITSVLGFGDSIAFGRGDQYLPGQFVEAPLITDGSLGYLKRLRSVAGIPTTNAGNPGEFFTIGGFERLASLIQSSNADIVAILEGVNDAGIQASTGEYRLKLQKAINIAKALDKLPVLFTLLPPCCDRFYFEPFTRDFSKLIRALGEWNDIPVIDIEAAWDQTCAGFDQCFLFNRPDGLHPNKSGYDLIAHLFLQQIFNINFLDGTSAEDFLNTEDEE